MGHSHDFQLKSPISTPKPSHLKVAIATPEEHSPTASDSGELNGNAQAKPGSEEMFKMGRGPLPQVHIDLWAKVRTGCGGRLLIMK